MKWSQQGLNKMNVAWSSIIFVKHGLKAMNEEINLRDTSYRKQVIVAEPLGIINYKAAPLF